jgi:hypothetical protein
MTTDALRKILEERPFRPFTVHMPDGRHLAVSTASFMAVHTGAPWAFVWNLHDAGYSLINLDQIVRLEFEAPVPAEAAPGH